MIFKRVGKYMIPTDFNPEEMYRIERIIPGRENKIITNPEQIQAIHTYLNDVHAQYNDSVENCYHKYLKAQEEKAKAKETGTWYKKFCDLRPGDVLPWGNEFLIITSSGEEITKYRGIMGYMPMDVAQKREYIHKDEQVEISAIDFVHSRIVILLKYPKYTIMELTKDAEEMAKPFNALRALQRS